MRYIVSAECPLCECESSNSRDASTAMHVQLMLHTME